MNYTPILSSWSAAGKKLQKSFQVDCSEKNKIGCNTKLGLELKKARSFTVFYFYSTVFYTNQEEVLLKKRVKVKM